MYTEYLPGADGRAATTHFFSHTGGDTLEMVCGYEPNSEYAPAREWGLRPFPCVLRAAVAVLADHLTPAHTVLSYPPSPFPTPLSPLLPSPPPNTPTAASMAQVAPEARRFRGLRQFFVEAFLPRGFPESVSPDYVQYQLWDTAQAFCSAITGTLATHATLKGLGVGSDQASAMR